MPAEYFIEVRYRWWFMPLLKLIIRFGLIKKGRFGKGMTGCGVGITGDPSVEIKYNAEVPE